MLYQLQKVIIKHYLAFIHVNFNYKYKGWNLIINDEAPGWLSVKNKPENTDKTAIVIFYELFYRRLFDAHPSCKPLFKNDPVIQGKALTHM